MDIKISLDYFEDICIILSIVHYILHSVVGYYLQNLHVIPTATIIL